VILKEGTGIGQRLLTTGGELAEIPFILGDFLPKLVQFRCNAQAADLRRNPVQNPFGLLYIQVVLIEIFSEAYRR